MRQTSPLRRARAKTGFCSWGGAASDAPDAPGEERAAGAMAHKGEVDEEATAAAAMLYRGD